MDNNLMKTLGIVCLVICAICIFVAVERYQSNADSVNAMNSMMNSLPLGGMMGRGPVKPATPAATKYAIFFALITGVSGAVLLVKSNNDTPSKITTEES
ncbi:MAG: hypothetical protein JEZ07_04815 [Phycisphaerae bacterium]|nr:hypothetical protein [Phycisphaerae bacterium]